MKTSFRGFALSGRFFLLSFLILAPNLFAAVPIQERALRGLTAAEARLKLIATAESFLGTPYRLGGLDRRGLDCSGLVYISFREGLNLEIPRTTGSIHSWAARIDSAELQPGDLVFFVTAGSRVSHVGIYVGDRRFIHSASEGPSTGVIISRLDEAYWRRTYLSAGRALPWDAEREPDWTDSGIFVGLAAAWTWGGLFDDASSPFRGLSAMASVGYKWPLFRTGLELRPNWDNTLGVFRLPIALSVGTDTFQVFGGPVYIFGEPGFNLENNERPYSGGNSWLWEAGISAAFSPVTVKQGTVSLYGELAWQPDFRGNGENFNLWHDLTTNLRASTGVRYLWRLK
jgi:probable lipoprotein NlpC